MSLKLKKISFEGNRFEALVALTIRGITRDVTFRGEQLGLVRAPFGGGQLRTAYEATADIDRKA